jgi:hypothetical protein
MPDSVVAGLAALVNVPAVPGPAAATIADRFAMGNPSALTICVFSLSIGTILDLL